ncbi:hypothetical protein BROUX41_000546 [Berkeleyomyces rouxiae]|uniref:uncharacterized protein n=1 Tax=Berkeleyomyces rouxiae TaxID=2035830 RepID=UPI003B81E963
MGLPLFVEPFEAQAPADQKETNAQCINSGVGRRLSRAERTRERRNRLNQVLGEMAIPLSQRGNSNTTNTSSDRPRLPRALGLGLLNSSRTDVPTPSRRSIASSSWSMRDVRPSEPYRVRSRDPSHLLHDSRSRDRNTSTTSLVEFTPEFDELQGTVDPSDIYREPTLSPEIDDAQWEQIVTTMPSDTQRPHTRTNQISESGNPSGTMSTSQAASRYASDFSLQPMPFEPLIRSRERLLQQDQDNGHTSIARNRSPLHASTRALAARFDDSYSGSLQSWVPELMSSGSDGGDDDEGEEGQDSSQTHTQRLYHQQRRNQRYERALDLWSFIVLHGRAPLFQPEEGSGDVRNRHQMSDGQLHDDNLSLADLI